MSKQFEKIKELVALRAKARLGGGEKEIRTIDKAPRNGAEGLKIAFLHPKSTQGVLTELCEE